MVQLVFLNVLHRKLFANVYKCPSEPSKCGRRLVNEQELKALSMQHARFANNPVITNSINVFQRCKHVLTNKNKQGIINISSEVICTLNLPPPAPCFHNFPHIQGHIFGVNNRGVSRRCWGTTRSGARLCLFRRLSGQIAALASLNRPSLSSCIRF